jgi:hypothetical protein
MNEELLAASVKVAPYWSAIMVLSTFLQLSNVKRPKSAVHQQIAKLFQHAGGTSKGFMTSILPLKMPTDYLNKMPTDYLNKSAPAVSFTLLRH